MSIAPGSLIAKPGSAFADVQSWASAHPSAFGNPKPPLLVLLAQGEVCQPPILAQSRAFRPRCARGDAVRGVVLSGLRHITTIPALSDAQHGGFIQLVSFIRHPRAAVQQADIDPGTTCV